MLPNGNRNCLVSHTPAKMNHATVMREIPNANLLLPYAVTSGSMSRSVVELRLKDASPVGDFQS